MALLLAWLLAGCQWLLDDIEPSRGDAAAPRGDATSDDGAAAAVGEDDRDEAPSLEGGGEPAARGRDAATREDARAEVADAGVGGSANRQVQPDASGVPLGGVSPAPNDAGGGSQPGGAAGEGGAPASDAAAPAADAGAPGEPVSCSAPVWWYEDADGDGYGRASARVMACESPAGDWAREAGDCNDDDARVHPDQREYFGAAYQAPGGTQSFDYDCSGAEEARAGQQAAPEGCGLLSVTLCTGSGYLPLARAGALNPLCGSHEKATCQAAVLGLLACEAITDTVVEPYTCR